MAKKPTYEELEKRVKELEKEAVERRQVEKRLEEKEQTLWALLNAPTETAILVDLEGTILAINEVAAQRIGKNVDELVGLGMFDYLPPDMAVSRKAQGDKVARSGKPARFQDKRAGRTYDTNIYPVFDVEKKVTALAIYARDITETKLIEAALRESEERLKSFYDAAFEGIAITDQGRFLDANRQFAEIFGYQRNELIGKEVMDLVAEEDREFVLGNIQSGFDKPYEHKALHKDGSIVFVEVQGRQVQFQGRPARVTAIHNLTDRILAEEALRESEKKYRKLFNTVSDAIVLFDAETREFIDVNDACLSVYGFSKDELFKLKHTDITVEFEESNKSIKQILSGEINRIPLRYHKRKNGEIFPVEISGGTFKLRDRQIVCGVVRDITERKQVEETIREERDKAQNYLDIASVILVALNPDQTIELINKKGCEILGYKEKEIVGKNWFDNFLPERTRDEVREVFDKLVAGDIEPIKYFENPVLTKSNKERMIAWHNAVMKDDNGNIIGTLSSGRDITEQRKAEEEKGELESYIQQSQKMEAIGNLAGGIAHDFNNILSPLIIHTELALLDLPGDSPIRQNLKEVLTAGNRAKDLVNQILTFSRQSEQEQKPLKISPIAKEALKLLRSSLPSTIEIRQNFEKELCTVLADPVQMHQVIMNLCTNAAHAMRDKGGVLEVNLVNIEVDSGYAASVPNLNPGLYLKLTVKDTGHGMDRSVMSRIFDPYFTTKGKSEGTGMGLAVVHGIIANHGGAIFVDSEHGKGTIFDICLPGTQSQIIQETIKQARPPKGTERILLVDDDQAMVRAVQQMLERLGYNVTPKTNSIEALDLFQADPGRFDIVITDQTMPNITGSQLAQKLMHVRNDIPIILCTGFSELIDEEKAKEMGIKAFVMKPVVMSEIGSTIRKVMDERD